MSKRFGVHGTLISAWKKQLLEGAAVAFGNGSGKGETGPEVDELLKKIGELTVERDFLSRVLRR